jgi:hypothetical protein
MGNRTRSIGGTPARREREENEVASLELTRRERALLLAIGLALGMLVGLFLGGMRPCSIPADSSPGTVRAGRFVESIGTFFSPARTVIDWRTCVESRQAPH